MKKIWLFCSVVVMLVTAGCSSVGLPDGRYLPAEDRGEYAIVYQDLIFLHMRAPDSYSGQYAFWDWGGSYSVGDDGILDLKMDNQTMKLWRFYYSFRMQGGMIMVEDFSTRKSYPMQIERKKLRNEVMQFDNMR